MAALMQAQCAARVAPAAAAASSGRVSLKAGFSGASVSSVSRVSLRSARGAQALRVRAADAPAKAAVKEEPVEWVAPKLNPNTPSPIFGSTLVS